MMGVSSLQVSEGTHLPIEEIDYGKACHFHPNEAGLPALLDLLRFTGAIGGYTVYEDGLSIVLPQPVAQRAKLWMDYCKEHGLSVGPHDGKVVDLDAIAETSTDVPAGTEEKPEPETPAPVPARTVEKPAKKPAAKKPVRKAPAQ
jgi:hypothetical protein